tara:strand:+ start:123 stop:623 length:501 start_codon:yes stop_codon:yes gene_type:complete
MIKVLDNVFNEDDFVSINQHLQESKWSFTGGDDVGYFKSFFWHMNFLEKDNYFLSIYKKLINHLELKNTSIVRIYANGQTAGQSGVPHQDDGDLTILYFPTPWNHYYGGHLNFIENNNLKSVIEYKTNRMVVFPAKTIHYASPPERQYDGLRISLAFKLNTNVINI